MPTADAEITDESSRKNPRVMASRGEGGILTNLPGLPGVAPLVGKHQLNEDPEAPFHERHGRFLFRPPKIEPVGLPQAVSERVLPLEEFAPDVIEPPLRLRLHAPRRLETHLCWRIVRSHTPSPERRIGKWTGALQILRDGPCDRRVYPRDEQLRRRFVEMVEAAGHGPAPRRRLPIELRVGHTRHQADGVLPDR